MKVLIYGMQSSGASLIAYFLSQKKNAISVVDLWHPEEAPNLDDADAKEIILKCVVTTNIPLETHMSNFKPDKTILILRHPFHNYNSLKKKLWANESGEIDEKFRISEKVFIGRNNFDVVILYEEFILNSDRVIMDLKQQGIEADKEFYQFNRSKDDIVKFNLQHSNWCKEYYHKKWAFGHIHFGKRRLQLLNMFKHINSNDKMKVRSLCPALCEYYEEKYRWNLCANTIHLICLVRHMLSLAKRKLVD